MRNYWLTEYFLAAIGWGYISVTVAAVALALWLPKSRRAKGLLTTAVLALASILPIQGCEQFLQERQAGKIREARYRVARDLFEERCKRAGEKINKTVEGVEGITLLNLRTATFDEREKDPNWAGAGLPDDATNDGYIGNYLEWEHRPGESEGRGYLTPWPKNAVGAGYEYVDVLQSDKTFLRFRLNPTGVSTSDYLVASPIKAAPSRYAVRYDDISEPGDRQHWVAGARVTVLDLDTNETLAELTAYAFEPGLGSTAGFRQPWRFAATCPHRGSRYATRFFVDQILKPIQKR